MKKFYGGLGTKKTWTLLFVLILAAWLLCLALVSHMPKLFVLSEEEQKPSIVFDSYAADRYIEILSLEFPDLEMRRLERSEFLRCLDEGRVPLVEISEWKAQPLLAAGKLDAFYPHYVDGIVIAVDRSRISEDIRGWRDLEKQPFSVLMISKEESLFAIAAGLDREFRDFLLAGKGTPASVQIPETVDFLKKLKRSGRLIVIDEDMETLDPARAPVMILPQSRAEELQAKGAKLDIIAPKEGSLAMHRGLGLQTSLRQRASQKAIGARLAKQSDSIRNKTEKEGGRSFGKGEQSFYFIENIEGYNLAASRLYEHYEREVHQKKKYRSILHLNRIMDYVLLLLCVALWTGWMQIRIVEDEVRLFVRLIFLFIVLWLLIRILRHMGVVDEATHIFWYAYYVPFIGIVTTWLILCGELTESERIRKYRTQIILMAVSAMLLILTNGFHSLVFRFENAEKSGPYHYTPLYHLIAAAMILTTAGSIILLFLRRKERMHRRRIWAPIFVGLSILAYHSLYILRYQPIFRTDMTMSYILFICLMLESMLYIGVINTNTTYRSFFVNNPQKIYLLSRDKTIMMKTKSAEVLSEDFAQSLFFDRANINRYLSEREGRQYRVGRIRGGYVLWEEDLQILLSMRRRLEENAEELLAKNQMRERENQLKQNLYRMRIRRRLMDEIEQAIADKIDAITHIASTLEERYMENDERGVRSKIACIKMMVSYCKRISNFIMLSRQSDRFLTDELVKALRETLQDSETAGIEYALVLREEGEISVQDALFIYEYIYRVVETAMRSQKPVVFIHLSTEEKKIRLKLVLSAEGEELCKEDFRFETLMGEEPGKRGYRQETESEYNSLEILLIPDPSVHREEKGESDERFISAFR
ncbi:MAG: histidine kinase N-terminal 7TM domain-containing protein [Peptostreptococcaceae bacterium]|nr:histidine kinase N-terminal 7TM domain-containing protein [Peptostreptococcaceae bacterium]